MSLRGAIVAGARYAALVFAAGFVLGVVRTVLVEPRLGPTLAVVAEIPVILAISWGACRLVVRRHAVSSNVAARIAMGAVALAVLLGAEVIVSIALAGRTLLQHLALYQTGPALLGFGGQLLFAAFPLLQRYGRDTTSNRHE